jgi:predicted small lipoprotein YifL
MALGALDLYFTISNYLRSGRMKIMPNLVKVWFLALVFTLAGCGSSDKTPAAAPPAASSPQDANTVTAKLSEADEKETEAFARQIEKSINANDASVLRKALNLAVIPI